MASIEPHCQVAYCNFPDSHVTIAHKCGICNKYGHGQIECQSENQNAINNLKKYYSDILLPENHCTFPNCKYKETHTKKAHHCHKCFRNHPSSECIIKTLDEFRLNFGDMGIDWAIMTTFFNNQLMIHGSLEDKYIFIPAGMGCCIYIKAYLEVNNTINLITLFMHADSYGQYGPSIDDTPIRDNFLQDCEDMTDLFNAMISPDNNNNYPTSKNYFACPMCRNKNTISKVLPIKGSTQQCTICLENEVELYFEECSHAIICNECFNKLDKII